MLLTKNKLIYYLFPHVQYFYQSSLNPSQTFTIGDGAITSSKLRDYFIPSDHEENGTKSGTMLYLDTRHNKRANIGFVDGHISSLIRSEITNDKSAGFRL